MTNALVLGASGMAGHVVALYLRENGYEVDTLSATQPLDEATIIADVLDLPRLKAILADRNYDVVINCIGILVRQSEERKDLATYINSFLPRFLEQYYTGARTKVIQLGTDAVFSAGTPPYSEDSSLSGADFYARTKIVGEIDNAKDLTLRMSIIGPELKASGSSLFSWLYQQQGEVSGYTSALWSGVTTLELARGIKAAIEQDLAGIYHFAPNSHISKYELLKLIKEKFSLQSVEIKPVTAESSDRRIVSTRTDFDFEVNEYDAMLGDLRNWIVSHSALYPHYSSGSQE
jgi:dTDP-4-dehydrorhamnose reductase